MKQIPSIITLATLLGCSDYTLQTQRQENTVIGEDAGFSDTGTAPLETYDPCDPYGAGWDIPPVRNERSDCVGIEGYALSDLSLEAKVWMLNEEERDSLRLLSEQEEEDALYNIHEPLTYALECDSNAASLDEDCTAFLY